MDKNSVNAQAIEKEVILNNILNNAAATTTNSNQAFTKKANQRT